MNRPIAINLVPFLRSTALRRGAIFGAILVSALLAFEIFNYSTTAFALADMLGDLTFAGLRWSTILAFAFCGIDFAGIARLFTPEQGREEPAEVWYLFGAWLLAASMNAALTWWGISVAIVNHSAAGGFLVGQATLTKIIPVFVAVMVWLIRVLVIGTFSIAGEKIFSMADDRPIYRQSTAVRPVSPVQTRRVQTPSYARPAPKPVSPSLTSPMGTEPSYHPVGMGARSYPQEGSTRR
jgi:hypothetical protein